MKIEVRRLYLRDTWTIGEVFVDGAHECFSLEDRANYPGEDKVPGETAIPCGTFRIEWRASPHFGKSMPYLTHVPNFYGVMIHPGNTPKDTRGCLLVGKYADLSAGRVLESKLAFESLCAKMKKSTGVVEVIVTEDKAIDDTRAKRVIH